MQADLVIPLAKGARGYYVAILLRANTTGAQFQCLSGAGQFDLESVTRDCVVVSGEWSRNKQITVADERWIDLTFCTQ